jgi:hypothetical protein
MEDLAGAGRARGRRRALILGVVVIAKLLAIGPALVSARQHPSPLLRSE